MNISKCPKCRRSLISEEIDTHECRKVIEYDIEDGILWLFDGKIWYPRKLINRRVTQRRSTDNETEPEISGFFQ